MEPEAFTIWVALGGLLTGAGGVLGYMAKQGLHRNGNATASSPIPEDAHHTLTSILSEMQHLNNNLDAAITENRETLGRIERRQLGKVES